MAAENGARKSFPESPAATRSPQRIEEARVHSQMRRQRHRLPRLEKAIAGLSSIVGVESAETVPVGAGVVAHRKNGGQFVERFEKILVPIRPQFIYIEV